MEFGANSYLLNLIDLIIKKRIVLCSSEVTENEGKYSIRILFSSFNLTADEISLLSGYAYAND